MTLILYHQKKWYAVFVGLIATWIVGIVIGKLDATSELAAESIYLIPQWDPDSFVSDPDFGLFGAVFTHNEMIPNTLIMSFITATVSLFVIDMFDTAGTLIGVGTEAGMIDSEGHLIDGDKALTSDAVASIAGAVVGTSTTTSFIESTTGIVAGARTGLMPVVVAALFAVALLFSGFFGTFTSACTVGALVLVGIMMIKGVKDSEWTAPVTCTQILCSGVSSRTFSGSDELFSEDCREASESFPEDDSSGISDAVLSSSGRSSCTENTGSCSFAHPHKAAAAALSKRPAPSSSPAHFPFMRKIPACR